MPLPKLPMFATKDDLETFYSGLVLKARKVAAKHGYALAVHGTMRRDLDLVAIPWTKRPHSPRTMYRDIIKALPYEPAGFAKQVLLPCVKPQGRTGYYIPLRYRQPNGEIAYADLSIFPPRT